MRKIVNLIAIFAVSTFLCACGMLSGLGSVPQDVKTSTEDVGNGAKTTISSFLGAQAVLLEAFDFKDLAQAALADKKAIESGELDDASDILEKSMNADKLIAENVNKVKSFSSAQKNAFTKGLVEYVNSSIELVKFGKSSSDYVSTVKSAIDSASATDKAAITSYTQNVLGVVQKMPELTNLVTDDTKLLIDTAQEAKLDVSKAKKAASDAFGF